MKLSFSQIQSFLKDPPETVRVFLVYGPDAGLAHERAQGLAEKLVPDIKDPFAVCSFDGDSLGSDTARLCDELATVPFTGGRKLVRITRASEVNAGPVADFLKNPCVGDSVLLIEAGDLSKKSKLRGLCEGASPLAAGIPCYVEDVAARQKTIAAFLANAQLSASRDVVRLLSDVLPPDRLALHGELDKLALYVKGQGAVTIEDVRAVVADAGGAEMDDLVDAVASGASARAMQLLDFLVAEQASPVFVLRAVQRHFMRLHVARGHMDRGASAQEAVGALIPPVFWKNKDPMVRQLARWTSARIEKRLSELLEAESLVKRTGTPDVALCAQLLLNMTAKG